MRRRFGLGVAAGVLAVGLLVVPVVPAGAETYQVPCRPGGIGTPQQVVLEITGQGPDGPVAAGESFVLSDLRVEWASPYANLPDSLFSEWVTWAELTIFGQVIELGGWDPEDPAEDAAPGGDPVWGPMDVELIAPEDLGEVGIVPTEFRAPWLSLVDSTAVCTGFDPDAPFAFVEVELAPEPPAAPNGAGENGTVEDGDDEDGDGAQRVRREIRRMPGAAGPVGASPAFTG